MNKKEGQKGILKSALDKVKLVDAGVKDKYGLECCPTKSSDEPNISYPRLYLDTREAPMLTGCDVEDEITLLVKAKVISHSLNENPKNRRESFDLEIKELGVVSTNKEKED